MLRDVAWGRPADVCLVHGVYRLQLHLPNLRVSLGATVTELNLNESVHVTPIKALFVSLIIHIF